MNFVGGMVLWGDKDTNFEAIAVTQARDTDDSDYGAKSGNDEKWLNLEYILQIEKSQDLLRWVECDRSIRRKEESRLIPKFLA